MATASEPTWLTPAAHQKLLDELDRLSGPRRIELEERIAEARSHGDIRENADYDAAKNEQGLNEARIRKIRHILHTSEVGEVVASDRVQVGCVVTVADGGDTIEYFVAPAENKVPGYLLASPTSPLGAALLGAKVGDEVSYQAPAGTFSMVVEAIRPYEG